MNEKTTSDIITTVLNETYTYLKPKHDSDELEIIKEKLLFLSGLNSFEFTLVKGRHYSYENIQDILSTLNSGLVNSTARKKLPSGRKYAVEEYVR